MKIKSAFVKATTLSRLCRSFPISSTRHAPVSQRYSTLPGPMLSSMPLSSEQSITGQSGRSYRVVSPLGSKGTGAFPNIWKAVDSLDDDKEVIIKSPSSDDDQKLGWPLFQHEVEMQKLFDQAPFVRQMIDFVPAVPDQQQPPCLVLQAFEKTLWAARWQRPMTTAEIKWIMKAVLLGIWTVHRKGLVYTDLKMENVLVNGFENESPGDVRSIIARISDCGTITPPSDREITSITYRSPEVHFSLPWNASTDIWSWGIIYCHLLEAQTSFNEPGMYDSICKGSLEDKAAAVRNALALDFDLYSHPTYTASNILLPPKPDSYEPGGGQWLDRLDRKGVDAEDLAFLYQVLNPNPDERWTAADIVSTGHLEI